MIKDPSVPETESVRSTAARRALLCTGAGYAAIGRPRLALAAFSSAIALLFAVIWFAVQPGRNSLWVALAILLVTVTFSLAERIYVSKAELRPANPAFLVGGIWATCGVTYVLAAATLFIFVTSCGVLMVVGKGMAPTLVPSERVLYHKRVDAASVRPGTLVLFRTAPDAAWGSGGSLLVSRVLAGPGDTLSVDDGVYVVNGVPSKEVADLGKRDVVITVPPVPQHITVPDASYFVVQDSPGDGYDSRVLSWAAKDQIVSSRIWRLSPRGFFSKVE